MSPFACSVCIAYERQRRCDETRFGQTAFEKVWRRLVRSDPAIPTIPTLPMPNGTNWNRWCPFPNQAAVPSRMLGVILNGIFYLVRSGSAWKLLPHDLPPWRTVYHYFWLWRRDGTWQTIHDRSEEHTSELQS